MQSSHMLRRAPMGTTLSVPALPRKSISYLVTIFIYSHSLSPQNANLSINSYVDGAIYQLKRYVDSHGQAGKDEMNSVCSAHVITLTASPKFNYCGCIISDSKLNVVFNPT